MPTRYLFARGLLELKERRFDDLRQTTAKIREGALAPEDPDRTEEKAAAYLEGRAFLAQRNAEGALEALSRAVSLSGYEYAIYRRGLAEAYLASKKLPEALSAARQASGPLDPTDLRLDLALDRERALLTLAETQKAMGRASEAAEPARQFLAAWAKADPGLPDTARARKLAAAAP